MLIPKRGDQFYIDGHTVLWCACSGVAKTHISFEVINGLWRGRLDRETLVVTTEVGNKFYAGPIVWVGKAPFHWDDYNAAITWLKAQIA